MSLSSHYQKVTPPADLQQYIEYIWTFKANIGSKTRQEIITPTIQSSLIFCLGKPGVRVDTLIGRRYANANIYCAIATRPFIIEQQGEAYYVGIELKPYGLAAFRSSAHAANSVGSLYDILDRTSLNQLLTSMSASEPPALAVQHVVSFLRSQIHPISSPDLLRITTCISIIKHVNGIIRVVDLARAVHVSPSTLRRFFDRCIGISPERFIGIIRYSSFIRNLVRNPDEPLSFVSTLHGYYDEAHAVKEFKRYTGVSRKDFFNKYDGIMQMVYDK